MKKIMCASLITMILLFLCLPVRSCEAEGVEMTEEQIKLNGLEPLTRTKIEILLGLAREKWPNHKIVLAETYRTQERQDKLFAKGQTTTTVKVSQHTRHKAADIYFVNTKRILKVNEAPYKDLAEMAVKLGLTAGFYWKVPFDPNHFELRAK